MSSATANGTATGIDLDEYRQELKDAAPEILKAGLPLTVAEGKNPGWAMGTDWQLKRLTVEAAERLIDRQKHPAIGIMLGPGGAIDFDVDGPDELKAFNDLFDGDPPLMPQYTSGREGGEHRLAAFDERLREIGKATVKYKTADGNHSVTVRIGCRLQQSGELSGAHSVCPPSLHSDQEGKDGPWYFTGKRYRWREGCDLEALGLPRLPDRVIENLLAAAKPRTQEKPSGNATSDAHAEALAAMLRIKIKGKEIDGSNRLLAVACRAVEYDLADGQAVATIREYETKKPFPRDWSDDEILQRIRDAEGKAARGEAIEISNGKEIEFFDDASGKLKTMTVPLKMGEVLAGIRSTTDNWPRRVSSALFIDDQHHGIGWLEKQAALFGWLQSNRKVTWHGGKSMVSREEVFHELNRTSISYDAVEVLPHFPAMANHYYACETPPVTNGDALRELLDRFRPETTIDRDLIQAALMTTFWGGPPGARPAFVIAADQGRGVGKTKLAEIIAYLAGGILDVSAGEDIGTLKQRMLSAEALTKRVALIDNVKTMRFSWAELESLITAPVISGKRMYVGEASRPNTITWFITLNGVNLSTDMSQRSAIIKLVKGPNDGCWYEDTIRFIDKNRERLIGDILGALQAEPFALQKYTRWAAWEKDVLSRLPEPGDAQELIRERQAAADSDQDDGELIEDYFATQLRRLNYDPETAQVRIPVRIVAEWYNEATNERAKTGPVTKRLKQMADEEQLKCLAADPSRTYGRCFVWTGKDANVIKDPISNDLETRYEHYRQR